MCTYSGTYKDTLLNMQSEVRQILDLDLRLHLIGSHLAGTSDCISYICMSQEFLFRHCLGWTWRTCCSTCCGSLPRVDMENMLLKRQSYLSSSSSVSLCSKSCSDPYRITLAYVRIRQHNLSILRIRQQQVVQRPVLHHLRNMVVLDYYIY
jgi:hypothetical protein